jgi:receptor expression-enhancing protein 5/6
VEQRTQVPKAYAFIGAVTLLTLLHFVNALAAPISNLIGWGLPAYLSFKALESPGNEDDAQWLTYWVIFGFFNFAEGFALRALLYYFPWYFSFKTLFILWLQLPAFRVSAPYYSMLLGSSTSCIPGCANNLLRGPETCSSKSESPRQLCPLIFE